MNTQELDGTVVPGVKTKYLSIRVLAIETAHPDVVKAIFKTLVKLHLDHELAHAPIEAPGDVLLVANLDADGINYEQPLTSKGGKQTLVDPIHKLDDYERKAFAKISERLAETGLELTRDGLDLILMGRLSDINPYKPMGVAILTDAKSLLQDAPSRIIVDGHMLLKWHHLSADHRKFWFDDLAAKLGLVAKKPGDSWLLARDLFDDLHNTSDKQRRKWVALVGRPEPTLPYWSELLVLGKSYFIEQ